MIREKPRFNRRRILTKEAILARNVDRLLRMTEHLGPDEELSAPARIGDQIVVPVVRRRRSAVPYKDLIRSLTSSLARKNQIQTASRRFRNFGRVDTIASIMPAA